MHFTLHHYHHPDQATAAQLDRIERMLGIIEQNQENIMATLEDLQLAQADTDAKIATVKADMEMLLAKLAAIPPAGMTPEQQTGLDAAVTHAKAINDSLSAVDAEVNPPAHAPPAPSA